MQTRRWILGAATALLIGFGTLVGSALLKQQLGLGNDWAMQIVTQVGNYGESYEAHVGADTPLKLGRAGSVNALWSNGGLLYAPPIR